MRMETWGGILKMMCIMKFYITMVFWKHFTRQFEEKSMSASEVMCVSNLPENG